MSVAFLAHQLMKICPRFTGRQIQPRSSHSIEFRTIRGTQSIITLQSRALSSSTKNECLETIYINALVQASSCRRSRAKWISQTTAASSTKRVTWVQPAMSYNQLPVLIREDIESIGLSLSKKRLMGLVDYYDENDHGQPRQEKSNSAGRSEIVAEPEMDRNLDCSRRTLLDNLDDQGHDMLAAVVQAINHTYDRIRRDEPHDNTQFTDMFERLFQLYQSLPRERFLYLNPVHRKKLLYLAQRTPKKTEENTLRFLSVLNDMSLVNIDIPLSAYNTAIHLVGRTLGRVTHREVESALKRWTLMEAFSSGDISTFNILLDVAVKGQQFALAEMIIAEMEQRGLQSDRFTRVGLIYYYGVRGDGDAIRRTYHDLVEKDMIVDTTVLNCVISSLLRAGEEEAAEHVYRRMKDISLTEYKAGENDRSNPKDTAKALRNIILRLKSKDNKLIRQLQQEQDISPDAKTFSVLVSHHVSETGDLDKIMYYLNEMQSFGIAPHGRIFMDLFRGFWNYGGVPFTLWNKTMLERVWQAFRELANQEETRNVHWDKWMVLWLLRAHTKCCGSKAALEKWLTIKEDWQKAPEYEAFMLKVIDDAVRKRQEVSWRKLSASDV